jgi:hypothetical protein
MLGSNADRHESTSDDGHESTGDGTTPARTGTGASDGGTDGTTNRGPAGEDAPADRWSDGDGSDGDGSDGDGSDGRAAGGGASAGWLAARPATTASLPAGTARALGRVLGTGPVGTLAEFVEATRAATGGGVAVEDLCHVDEETRHVAETDGETYHFRCFYDGVVLAHVLREPVEVRTVSPGGAPVEVRVSADGEVDATPSGAAMSLGVATDAATDGDGPTADDVYGAVCPYVRAFPSREGYERWAADVDAATVGMPLPAGVPVAAALAE